jgi:hypothetical protein
MTRTSWAVGGVGVLLLVAGVGVFAMANAPGAGDVGWAAYAPLEPDAYSSRLTLTFGDGAVLWTGQHAVGAGLAVLGLLVLVGLGGWLLGRRSAP